LKIRRIEPIAVSLPMKKPIVMAGIEIARAENVLVRVETESGAIGWGEAAEAPTMTGETVESMVAAVSLIAPALIGREAQDIEGATAAMASRMYGNSGAKAAIDMALHDLVGRATGRPAYALLGGKARERIAILGVIGNGTLDGDLREAEAMKAAGFRSFKIKVGGANVMADAKRTRALCELLGPELLLCSDANQGWSVPQALEYVRAVRGAGLAFFEQPVRANDIDGMAAVAAAADCAIGADESIHGLDDIRRHRERNAARGASLKTIKLGGMGGVMAAGRLCHELGMAINVSSKAGESSLACAAALHLASALPSIDWGLTINSEGLSGDIVTRPVRIERGHAAVPEGSGLGVEVDEALVARFRRDVPVRRVA
jgi:L-alanine-DL-glutamate epimerase-like enolase superfamily enzyme